MSKMSEKATRQDEWLDGLREMVAFFEANPDLTPIYSYFNAIDVDILADPKIKIRRWVRALGTCDKEYKDNKLSIVAKPGRFGPHTVMFHTARESVCERKVELVEKKVTIRSPEAVEAALALIPEETVTITEEVVTWDCRPILEGAANG